MTSPFDEHPGRYDAWYERYPYAYETELSALRQLLPEDGPALEIGAGTGRFAAPLGITFGVDLSLPMLRRARERGIIAAAADAAALPFPEGSFARMLVMMTLCFSDEPSLLLREAHRVLRPGGTLLIGIIEKNSSLGRRYAAKKDESPFYRAATLFTADEALDMCQRAGFGELQTYQTLFTLPEILTEPEPLRKGAGQGCAVFITGVKQPRDC